MDLKTASGSDMSKKKAPKSAFHGPAGGFFAQKKRVVLGNVKHSGDERNISLSKSGPGDSVYFNVDSLSGDDKDVGMTGVYGGFLLDLAATTSKVKHVDTGTMFGSPLGFSDFTMDDNKIVLSFHVFIPLEKKWIDPKIVKTQVEVSVKIFFALDIDLSAVIRKLFLGINGFEGATTPSKFEKIIRSTFTSEASMEKTASLAKNNNIIVNTDFKRQGMHSGQAVVIKEIPMDTSKEMIVTTVAEFGEIKSIKIQLIGMWQKAVVEFTESGQADQLASKWSFLIGKDLVRVAKAVGDHNIWVLKDHFRALLFTLPVGTTAHDIGTLLDKPASFANRLQLARLYAKKNVPISHSAAFGGKSWAQVVSLAFFFGSGFGFSAFSHGAFSLGGGVSLLLNVNSSLSACLAFLEHSLELLNDQVSGIMHKLNNVNLVPLVPSFSTSGVLAAPAAASFDMALDDTLNNLVVTSPLPFGGSDLGSSSSKVLTSKVGSLESKLLALDASVGVILEKLD
ncbi:hypothetical protein G9A89_008614 [Geosiphon pyriformis]|nr:hypothetical protein G9A89_008614 [Geosiphon pyriformis]